MLWSEIVQEELNIAVSMIGVLLIYREIFMSTVKSKQKAYDEIIDLFANGSSPEKIVSFKPSDESQDRVRVLLAKIKSGQLTPEEAELDDFGMIEHLMRLVKARARQKAKNE